MFAVKPVFLVTDIMLFATVFLLLYVCCCICRDKNARLPWWQLLSNKLYNSCGVILLFFLAITILDSIHFRALETDSLTSSQHYSSEVKSVFDVMISPLGMDMETSYSKPFATESLNKKYSKNPDGSYHSYHPQLKLVNSLTSSELVKAMFHNFFMVTLSFFSLMLLFSFFFRSSKGLWHSFVVLYGKNYNPIAYQAILTAFVIVLFLVEVIFLSHHFHIFGTNKIGVDVFYQTLKSIRTGVVIGTITTLFSLPLAIFLGISSGYFGKRVDDIIQYIYTTISTIPGILLITAAIMSLQLWMGKHASSFETMYESADLRLLLICFVLGITGWPALCRLIRGETLKIREMDYITAAHMLGVSKIRVLFKHILPNVMYIVLIVTVIDFSALVLAEAVLSYVGVGVASTTISWGNMINSARLELSRDPAVWWPLLATFIFMFGLVLTANIFADGVRKIFDPRSYKSVVGK